MLWMYIPNLTSVFFKYIYIHIYIYVWYPPQLSKSLGVVEGETEAFRGQMPTCLGYFLAFASFNLCTRQPFPVFFIFHRWGT